MFPKCQVTNWKRVRSAKSKTSDRFRIARCGVFTQHCLNTLAISVDVVDFSTADCM